MTIHINRGVNPPEAQGCPSGLHEHNRTFSEGDDWHAVYNPGGAFDNPVNLALFGLARQSFEHFPTWVQVDPKAGPILDLGPGHKYIHGADRLDYPEYDFDDPSQSHRANDNQSHGLTRHVCSLPYEANSVAGIFAINILEHLWDPRPIMAECARVLQPGAPFNVFVPHGLSVMHIQDLDHKKQFNMDSFKNWLFNPFYGEREVPLRIGTLFKFAVKEGNEAIICQMIKKEASA